MSSYWNKVLKANDSMKWGLIKLSEKAKEESLTQSKITNLALEIAARLPNKPKRLKTRFYSQLDMIWELIMRNDLSFCYNVNGKLYKTSNGKIDAPKYDTLDNWQTILSESESGFYWDHSGIKYF